MPRLQKITHPSALAISSANQRMLSEVMSVIGAAQSGLKSFSKMKLSAAFHGHLKLKQLKKIPKILKLMNFPCVDALSYSHLCEGKLDVVMQCQNRIWDIHPLIPIIKASGGIVTTWKNEDAKYAGNVLVSANKTIHRKFLKLLRPALK